MGFLDKFKEKAAAKAQQKIQQKTGGNAIAPNQPGYPYMPGDPMYGMLYYPVIGGTDQDGDGVADDQQPQDTGYGDEYADQPPYDDQAQPDYQDSQPDSSTTYESPGTDSYDGGYDTGSDYGSPGADTYDSGGYDSGGGGYDSGGGGDFGGGGE